MKNKLIDLNNHLFAQLERLGDESLSKSELTDEMVRARAMTALAAQIIDNARLSLEAEQFRAEYTGIKIVLPTMIEDSNDGQG